LQEVSSVSNFRKEIEIFECMQRNGVFKYALVINGKVKIPFAEEFLKWSDKRK